MCWEPSITSPKCMISICSRDVQTAALPQFLENSMQAIFILSIILFCCVSMHSIDFSILFLVFLSKFYLMNLYGKNGEKRARFAPLCNSRLAAIKI